MHELLKLGYYAMIIVLLLWEILIISDTEQWLAWCEERDNDEKKIKYGSILLTLWSAFYFIWLGLGVLLTFQWPFFLIVIIMGILPTRFMKKVSKRWRYWEIKIDSGVTIVIFLFVLLNAYYFKIDVFKQYIKPLFQNQQQHEEPKINKSDTTAYYLGHSRSGKLQEDRGPAAGSVGR